MLQDTNVERYVDNAIKPLKKEIAKLKVQIEELNKALRKHDVSGQLKAFAKHWNETRADFVTIDDCDIEDFLSL